MKNSFVQVLIAESGSGYGGTAKYLADLLPVLHREGIHPRVVSYGDGPFIQKIIRSSEPVVLRPEWRFPANEAAAGKLGVLGLLLTGLPQIFIQAPKIEQWLRSAGIGVVHLNNEIWSHLPLLIASRRAGCRVLCHLHGWRPMTRLERMFLGCVDTFVCISRTGAEYFSRMLGVEVAAAPNGVPAMTLELKQVEELRTKVRESLKIAENSILFTLAGRIVPWKGQEIFLKAFARVKSQEPRVKGLILGKDTSEGMVELKRLQSLVVELGVKEDVLFVPWMEDVTGAYAASDAVVHASTQPEPFGLVILEAMNAGRAVIAARGGGVTDIIVDGVSGLMVEPGDAGQLSEAMLCLTRDSDLRSRLAEAGQKRARSEFTMESNGRIIAGLYRKLLNSGCKGEK